MGGGTTYVDWAMLNNGSAPAVFLAAASVVELRLDGVTVKSWLAPAEGYVLPVGLSTSIDDYALEGVPPGLHTLTMVCDPGEVIEEIDDEDNILAISATWSGTK